MLLILDMALKNLFYVFAFLFSSSIAFSCPNLSGSYICHEADGPVEGQMAQTEHDGITTYTWTESGQSLTVAADGLKRILSQEPHENGTLVKSNINFCLQDQFVDIVFEDAVLDTSGSESMVQKIHQILATTTEGIHVETSVMTPTGDTKTEFHCQRK